MSEKFRNPKVFAVVAALFAVTTWLNWSAAPAEDLRVNGASITAQVQVR